MRNHLHFLNPVIPSDVLNYDSSIRTKHTSSSSGSNPGISIQITFKYFPIIAIVREISPK